MKGNASPTNQRRGARRQLRAHRLLSGVVLAAIAATACSTILDIKPGEAEEGRDARADLSTNADAPLADDAPTDGALEGAADALADGNDAGPARRIVFVSRELMQANMKFGGGASTGRASADSLCMQEAAAAGLTTGTFVAWLSLSSQDAIARLQPGPPWGLRKGPVVFGSTAVITSAKRPAVVISQHADGADLLLDAGDVSAWTGTTNDGKRTSLAPGGLCDDWTSNAAGTVSGRFGNVADAITWSSYSDAVCESTRHVYCFQQ